MFPFNASYSLAQPHDSSFVKCWLCRILWYFVIGAVFGCLYETILTLVRTGTIQRRVGLIYGPFNTIYGLGAAAMYLSFGHLPAWIKGWSGAAMVFLIGAIACSALEYFASWFQERFFGSQSWNYSNQPLNINGRVCLYAALAWGGMAVAWVWWIQPLFERLIRLIPSKWGIPLTIIVFALLLADAGITVAAMTRWVQRMHGTAAVSAWAQWLDIHYPDKLMQTVFPNMQFLH